MYCSDKATQTMVELLATYTEENASQAREDAHKYVIVIENFLFMSVEIST